MTRTVVVLVLLALFGCCALSAHANETDPERRALDWLVANAWDEDDLTPAGDIDTTATGMRWSAKAILAFVLESHPDRERYAKARRRLTRDLLRALEAEPSVPHRTWLLGFIGLWLAERGRTGEDVSAPYETLLAQLTDAQNAEGGWAHAKGFSLPIYPTTVIAATNWALLALGTGRRLGMEVDETSVARALSMLEQAQGDTGAFPYGGPTCRKGYEAGRTAGCVAALAALGQEDTEMFRRAADCILKDPAAVPRGHSSPPMHVLMGALAFRLLGDDAWARYEQQVLASVRGYQMQNGVFNILTTGVQSGMPTRIRNQASDLYVTACCAAALAMPRTKLAAALRAERPPPPEVELPAPSSLVTLWSFEVPNGVRLTAGGDRAFLCGAEYGLESLTATDGTVRYAADLPLEDAGSQNVTTLIATPERTYVMLQGSGIGPGAARVLALDTTSGSTIWQHALELPPRVVRMSPTHVYVATFSGVVLLLDLATGEEHRRIEWPRPMPGFCMDAGPDGRLLRTYEFLISVHTPDGQQVWERKSERPAEGVNRPSWSHATWLGDRIVAGRDDGTLEALAGDDGRSLWSTTGGAGIAMIQAMSPQGPLLVLDFVGRVRLVSGKDGSELWHFDLPQRKESAHPRIPVFQDGLIVVASPGDERTFFLDPRTGRVRHTLRTSGHAQVAAADGVIFVLDHGRLWALRHADPQ